ncbi:MAG TPA: Na/Pi symporter, partial [Mariprofundaceae bacterium]|nr:Na/Pi symporter [Mariprofundaceae bacterium]
MNLLGGLGLFLLGMHLMTNGLKVSAGNALRRILAASAKTRMRGVLSGMFITSVVQSSSAVTVANIGFVNAGLLTLAEAVAITY